MIIISLSIEINIGKIVRIFIIVIIKCINQNKQRV